MKKRRLFSLVILALIVSSFIITLIFRESIEKEISFYLGNFSYLALFLVSFILEFFPSYIAPQLLSFNAYFLGLPLIYVIAALYAGSVFGSWLGFEVGRIYKNRLLCHLFEKKDILSIEKKVNLWGKWFVFLSAISPLPYVPMIFGASGLKRSTMFYFGIIPRLLFFVFLGARAYHLFSF